MDHAPAPTSPFDWVFFDLDETLWDHPSASRSALGRVAARWGFDEERLRAEFYTANERLWAQMRAGLVDFGEMRWLRFVAVLEALGRGGNEALARDMGDAYLEEYRLYEGELPGASIAIEAAHAAGSRVAILTNARLEIQRFKLAQLAAREKVEFMLTTEEAGALKPSPAFYDAADRRAGGPAPDRVLYVGDSWEYDIAPGAARGWRCAWISGDEMPDALPGVQRIGCVSEVARLVCGPQ